MVEREIFQNARLEARAPSFMADFRFRDAADLAWACINEAGDWQVSTERAAVKRCIPALAMHVLNFMYEHPSAPCDALKSDLEKLKWLVRREVNLSYNTLLPSVGCEVEMRYAFFPFQSSWLQDLHCGLQSLGLDIETEGPRKTEIVLPATNCARVQSQMIYELRKAGLIPLDGSLAPLHVNLGIGYGDLDPDEVEEPETLWAIATLATYGFGTVSRIDHGGWFEPYTWLKEDVLSTKISSRYAGRVEFRTPRVVGSRTYRLIKELQLLGSLLTYNEALLCIGDDLTNDADKLCLQYKVPNVTEDFDLYKCRAVKAMGDAWSVRKKKLGTPNLISDARGLMSRYALRTQRIIASLQ